MLLVMNGKVIRPAFIIPPHPTNVLCTVARVKSAVMAQSPSAFNVRSALLRQAPAATTPRLIERAMHMTGAVKATLAAHPDPMPPNEDGQVQDQRLRITRISRTHPPTPSNLKQAYRLPAMSPTTPRLQNTSTLASRSYLTSISTYVSTAFVLHRF